MPKTKLALTLRESAALLAWAKTDGDLCWIAETISVDVAKVEGIINRAMSKWRHPMVCYESFTSGEHKAAAKREGITWQEARSKAAFPVMGKTNSANFSA